MLLNDFLMPLCRLSILLNNFHRRLNSFHKRRHDFLRLVHYWRGRVADLVNLLSLSLSRLYFSTLFFDFVSEFR